jgi:DNA-3-methyladenine glycosylase
MDYVKFFDRKTDVVARDLLGRMFVRSTSSGDTIGRIIEIGAYVDGNETYTRTGMKYSAGTIFLMSYRSSRMLNIATGKEGRPSCVEIRGLEINDKVVRGSGRVTNVLNIGEDLDGILLGDELTIAGERAKRTEIVESEGQVDHCVGIYSIK